MKRVLIIIMSIFGLALIAAHAQKADNEMTETSKSIYDITVLETRKQPVSISDYKGNAVRCFAPAATPESIKTEIVLCQK